MSAPRAIALCAAAALAGCAAGLPPPSFEPFDPEVLPGPADYPDVGAVVLLSRGELRFTADTKLRNPLARLRRLRRVRVLRPSGLDEAIIEARIEPTTRLHGFRVRATWPNGQVEIFDEPERRTAGDGVPLARIIVPDAAPGMVLEAVWDTWYTDPRFVAPWRFDAQYPTRRSEYAVEVPPGFEVDLRFSDEGRFVERPPERFETPDGVRFSWSLADLPARFEETETPAASLLAPRAHVLWRSARIAGVKRTGFLTWDDVGTWLLGQLPNWSELSEETRAEAERVAGELGEEERALRLLEVVARDVRPLEGAPPPTWRASLVHPEVALASGRADPTSKGLLLVALLRAIGLPAVPVLYAARGEDVLLPDVPTVRALHGIAAAIPRPERMLVLNPNELTVGAGLTPPALQGQRAVLLRSDVAEVTRIPPSEAEASVSEVVYTLRLDPRGDVFGELEARFTGAEAAALRSRLIDAPPEAYAERVAAFLAERGATLAPESVGIADLRVLRRPLVVTGRIDARGRLEREDEGEVFFPLALLLGAPGPTPMEVRRGPRVLGVPRATELRMTLSLPEGWRATFAPPVETMRGPGLEASLGARVETARRLGFVFRTARTKLRIPPEAHRAYRQHILDREASAARTFGLAKPVQTPLEY